MGWSQRWISLAYSRNKNGLNEIVVLRGTSKQEYCVASSYLFFMMEIKTVRLIWYKTWPEVVAVSTLGLVATAISFRSLLTYRRQGPLTRSVTRITTKKNILKNDKTQLVTWSKSQKYLFLSLQVFRHQNPAYCSKRGRGGGSAAPRRDQGWEHPYKKSIQFEEITPLIAYLSPTA